MDGYRFPLFVDLRGKKAVVVGAGPIAQRRIGVLLDFGADVTVIAPTCEALPKQVHYIHRTYEKGDLAGAFLAVAATNDRAVNHQIGQDAGNAGIFVTVADCREESTFYFPAICKGGGLVSGIVSQGEAHQKTARAAKAIRALLEELE